MTGDDDTALDHYRQALSVRRRVPQIHPALLAFALNNVGAIYCEIGESERAQPYLRESLGIARDTLGRRNADLAAILSTQASCLMDLGEYDDAIDLYRHALRIRQRKFGKEHPATVATRHNLTLAYARQGDIARAERLQVRNLARGRKAFGEDSLMLAKLLYSLAERT